MKTTSGSYPGSHVNPKHVDRHTTIEREPETLLEYWLKPVRSKPVAGLSPSPESKAEAEKFLHG